MAAVQFMYSLPDEEDHGAGGGGGGAEEDHGAGAGGGGAPPPVRRACTVGAKGVQVPPDLPTARARTPTTPLAAPLAPLPGLLKPRFAASSSSILGP